MAFKILSASKYTKELKVRIQKTGRLGFSGPTQEALQFDDHTFVMLVIDDEAQPDDRMALVVLRSESPDAFPAILSGNYYYLATTNLFDALGYDYRSESIYFTLKRASEFDEELGGDVYLMHQRKAKGRPAGSREREDEEDEDGE